MATFCDIIYGPLDWGMVSLQFCRWKFSQKETCSKLYSIEVKVYFKKSLFEPPFAGLRPKGNVRTASIAHWKARGRLTSYSP